MRTFMLAAAFAGGLFFAGSASAETYVFTRVQMQDPNTVHLSVPGGIDANVLLAPVTFTEAEGDTFLAYCLDLYHTITRGFQDPPLSYHSDVLDTSTTFGGPTLSNFDIGRISYLIRLGSGHHVNITDRNAIQGGIWEILGGTVTTHDAFLQSRIDFYGSTPFTSASKVHLFVSDDHKQSFGAVPEAATWALMILGFGGAGAMLRRRRLAFS